MLLPLLAVVVLESFAPTLQAAALRSVYSLPKKPLIVSRVNIAGPYAAVLMRGAMMEGSPVVEPILVQRFSRGWQALDALNFRCRLESHRLGKRTSDVLMQGMPSMQDDRPCKDPKDAGTPAEVETVRALMRGPLIPYVVVSGNWAIGEWYGGGGGETLFNRRNGHWKRFAGGGGAMSSSMLEAWGVPPSALCKFGMYDAKCPSTPR